MKRGYPAAAVTFVIVLLASCGERNQPGRTAPRGGSTTAGLNSGAVTVRLDSLREFQLSETPSLEIGTVEGDSSYIFSDIRGAIRLRDGLVVVADNGSKQLRFFDGNGRIVRSVGRSGQGPGEFLGMVWIGECMPDSIFVFDIFQDRISVFDRWGNFARVIRLMGSQSDVVPHFVDCNGRGTMILATRSVAIAEAPGPHRSTTLIELADTDGRVAGTLGRFPGDERYRFDRSDGPRPLGKRTLSAIAFDRVYVGTGDSYELNVYDLSGSPHSVIHGPEEDRSITEEIVHAFVEERLRRISNEDLRDNQARQWRRIEYPETFPPYASLLVDTEGNLWVKDYPRPKEERSRWLVFSSQGILTAWARIPSQFRVFQIDEDFLLGTWRDSLDVEYVRMYGVSKN